MKLSPTYAESHQPDGAKVFKIGTMARELGISPSMIRAWEKLGLARPLRTSAGYRLYTTKDMRVMKRAVYLRRVLGLNAAAIVNQLKQEGALSSNHNTSPPGGVNLGHLLHKLRLDHRKSLAQVATPLGISVGFMSNLERGQENASIALLRKIAQHYGVNIVDLFNTVNEVGTPVVRPRDRKILSGTPGVQMELLAWGKIIMEPHIFRIAPKAGSPEFYSHEGEEFLFIIEGEFVIHLNETAYKLRTGDSFYFESKIPHRWINPGKSQSTILWINTPPTF